MSDVLFYAIGVERIGVRQLNQATSRILERVRRGETLEVTDRGRPVARLIPIPGSVSALELAVAVGRAAGPTDSTPFPPPPVLGDPAVDVAAELVAARRRERW